MKYWCFSVTEGCEKSNSKLGPFIAAAAKNSPGEKIPFLINCKHLMCTIKFNVGYTPDLILEWFSCFLHPSHLSGSSCGLVKTWNPALGCRALQYHFHPSKGPCSGNKGIYRLLANSAPALVPLQFLRQSSFPLGRAHEMGHLTWNWNAIASACSGNLVCESTAKRMRWF